jgi:serine phosphatase RsbU (regulator of sigma subunit)
MLSLTAFVCLECDRVSLIDLTVSPKPACTSCRSLRLRSPSRRTLDDMAVNVERAGRQTRISTDESWAAAAADADAVRVRELSRAARIQRALMGDPPRHAHWSIGAAFRPCTELSGDVWMFADAPEDSLAVLVADVSGHGVHAALAGAAAAQVFALVAETQADPAKLLSAMHVALERRQLGLFISATAVVLKPDRTALIASAGGTPVLVHDPGEEPTLIAPEGLVLGVPEATYDTELEVATIAMPPGRRLALITDGVFEAPLDPHPDATGIQGRAGVMALMASVPSDPQQAADEIILRACQTAGGTLPDDATAVVIRSL